MHNPELEIDSTMIGTHASPSSLSRSSLIEEELDRELLDEFLCTVFPRIVSKETIPFRK